MAERAKSLLLKLRFIEWVSTQHGDLSALQMAVAVRLTSAWNPRTGFAWPSLDGLAADFGVSRRTIVRVLNRLVDLGIFTKRRGGGRGHANQYAPCLDRVPEGCAYAVARAINSDSPVTLSGEETGTVESPFSDDDDAQETGTSRAETGTTDALNSDRRVPPTEVSNRGIENRSSPEASACADAPPSEEDFFDDEQRHLCRKFRQLDGWLKANDENTRLSAETRHRLAEHADRLEAIADCEDWDSRLGNWAGRIASEIRWRLDVHEGAA